MSALLSALDALDARLAKEEARYSAAAATTQAGALARTSTAIDEVLKAVLELVAQQRHTDLPTLMKTVLGKGDISKLTSGQWMNAAAKVAPSAAPASVAAARLILEDAARDATGTSAIRKMILIRNKIHESALPPASEVLAAVGELRIVVDAARRAA